MNTKTTSELMMMRADRNLPLHIRLAAKIEIERREMERNSKVVL